jgi:hypothetical protein
LIPWVDLYQLAFKSKGSTTEARSIGTGEAPGSDSPIRIRARRLPWLPAQPEAAIGLPMMEEHGSLRAPSVDSVPQW